MENNENNVQNQDKKQKKGLSTPLVVVMLIAMLIIGIGGGYLLSNNDNLFNKNGAQSNNTNNIENNITEQNKISKKIDENKDWVYNAEYGNNKPVKTINSWNNEVLSSKKELIVPYININSTAGKNANKEIEKLYEEMYNKYATNINADENIDAKTMTNLKYRYYINNNILSVVIESSTYILPGGAGRCPLYVYNFNLDTLENATNEELAKQSGYNSITEVNEIVNKWITKEKTDEEIEEIAGSIMGLVNDTYFVDSNNKLNFVYTVAAAGTYDRSMAVDEIKDVQINNNKN